MRVLLNLTGDGSDLTVPTTVSEQVDYDSPYLRITRTIKCMPSGEQATFYVRHEADVAVCVPVTADGEIVLVQEYRHGPAKWLYEIPGGNVDRGETACEAVAREVLEETGFSGEVKHLCSTWISAYSTAQKHIYIMWQARQTAAPTVAQGELFQVVRVSLEEFRVLVGSGQLTDLDAGLASLNVLRDAKTALESPTC
jgi:ADP-ribose pyrophosphatase